MTECMIYRMRSVSSVRSLRRRKSGGTSTSAAQLRTDDGAAFVEVAAGHNITVKTPARWTATKQVGQQSHPPTTSR